MISQRCPKCFSRRIRRGYRPTPLWSKFLFRYNLLCDNCNWEFKGFAVPGTVSAKPTKNPKKKTSTKESDDFAADSSVHEKNGLPKGNGAPAVAFDNLAGQHGPAEKNGRRKKSGV